MPYKDPQKQKEAQLRHMTLKRARRKKGLLKRLGNKCAQCTETEGLQFDHIDPSTKLFDICGNGALTWNIKVLIAEVDKCQLLCRKHHAAKTKAERNTEG